MSRCARGSLVFWLLMMLFTGAWLCTCNVCAEGHERTGVRLGNARWRDWFLDEDNRPASSDSDSGPLVRRITPKSVFIAPSFSGCSEGYRQDGMGRCVKLVKVNQAAQLDFILQKLNSKFAPLNNKNNNNNKEESGPFHVNIPFDVGTQNKTATKDEPENQSVVGSEPLKKETGTTETPKTTTDVVTELDTTTTKPTSFDSEAPSIGNTSVSFLESNASTGGQMSSMFSSEGIHSSKVESTVKRQPDASGVSNNSSRPFVIVVANSTDYSPFADTHRDERIKTTTEVNGDEFSTESSTRATTYTNPANTVTTTETVFVPFEYNNSTESTITIEHINDEDSSTISAVPSFTSSTFFDIEPVISTVSPAFEPPKTEDIIDPSVTDSYVSTTTTSLPDVSNTDEDGLEEEGQSTQEDLIPLDVDPDKGISFGERLPDREHYSEKDELVSHSEDSVNKDIQDSYSGPSSYGSQEEEKVDCESFTSLPGEDSFGRVVNLNPNRCRTVDVTTVGYPIWTTTPRPPSSYYVRFPVDGMISKPSFSSSSSVEGSNGFIRFPERPSISSPYRPLPYGTKIWSEVDGVSSSSTSSSGTWYPPPSSWFPFFQSHKNWMDRYNRNTPYENGPVPMPNPYRKQYHNYRSPPFTQGVPSWIDKRLPWSQRDR